MNPTLLTVRVALAALLLMTQTVTAQTLDFVRSAGGTSGGTNTGQATATDADGNVYMTGNFTGTIDFDGTTLRSAGGTDFFVAKYNASGTVLWARRGGGSGDDSGNGIAVATVNGVVSIYVTGSFAGTADFTTNQTSDTRTSAGGSDLFLAKYDASGVKQWVQRGGGSSGDEGSGVAVATDGSVYVTGNFQGTANFTSFTTTNPASNTLTSAGNSFDVFLAKYNPSGVLQWLQRGGGSGFDTGRGVAVAPTPDGSVYLTGFFRGTADFNTPTSPASNTLTSAGGYDVFLVKYNASGAVQWLQRGGGMEDDYGYGLAVAPDGSVYLTGLFRSTADFNTPTDPTSNTTLTSAGADELFVAKYDASGAVQWLQRGGGGGDDWGIGVAVATDGSVYVTGSFERTANFNTPSDPTNNTLITAGGDDLFVLKYNAAGVLQWVRRGGGTGNDASLGVAVTPAPGNSHSVYVTGSFQDTADFNTPTSLTSNTISATGDSDVFLAKYDAQGNPQLQMQVRASGVAAEGRATATDSDGNIYVTGYFTGAARFGNTALVSAGGTDLFVAKYNPAGVLEWVRRGGGSGDDSGRGVAVAPDGSVYVTGFFRNTADFNTPTDPTSNTLTSAGGDDVFLTKYDASGGLQWLKRGGGAGDDVGNGVAVATAQDGSVSVYVTGKFEGTANFNTPTNPTSNTLTSAGNFDLFLAKYNASGGIQLLKRGGGIGVDQGAGVAVAPDGSVYVTGSFEYTANFNTPSNPTGNTITWGGDRDMFLVKYNVSGVLQWLQSARGADYGEGVAVAPDGSVVYVTGYFEGPATFNTPTNPTSISPVGGFDLFVAKYAAVGAVQWARRAGGRGDDRGAGVAVAADGSVYVTGYFQGTADFNPASNILTSAGNNDVFVAKYAAAGAVQWFRRGGGSGNDSGRGVAVAPAPDGSVSVYVTGFFEGTANFNPASNTLTSVGYRDLFVAKYQSVTVPPSITVVKAGTLTPTSCSVSARLTVTGSRITVVGPVVGMHAYTFTRSFTTPVTNYGLFVNSMTTPGTYTVTAFNDSGQTAVSYYAVSGTACNASGPSSAAPLDRTSADKAAGPLSLSLIPSSLTYAIGQLVTVRVSGGTSGTAYAVDLYDSPDTQIATNLSNWMSYSTSQGPGNTIIWGNNPTEEFYVIFQPGTEGIDRVLEVSDPTFAEFVDSSPFAIEGCAPVSVMIEATPSLVVAAGSSVTLTASGAESYTWSTGSSLTAISVAPPDMAVYSVTGTASNGCSGTATALVSSSCLDTVEGNPVSLTQTALLGATNCSVRVVGEGYGDAFVLTGPGGYVFSAVYRRAGNYSFQALDVRQPGTYLFRVSYTNACGQVKANTMTYLVTGTACP